MGSFFNAILIQPLLNTLVFLYEYVSFQDLGIAIILLTIVIRVILYPLFYKSLHNQSMMQKIQPEIEKVRHEHKDNKEKQAQVLMELYRTHKVNPFMGFLLILIQLPILISLYHVILKGFTLESFSNLYSFITPPAVLNHSLLGLIDLQQSSIVIVGLAAILQYFQGKLALPKKSGDAKGEESPAAKVGRQMVFIGPILTLLILNSLPGAVGLYWATTSAFSIVQQIIVNKTLYKEYGGDKTNNSKNS
ncbi:MAG: putative 60 kDa inner membrane insertion protein [Parcubacteria group bacterium Gr01-1014_3]|nr:MAG: putative 60 kDa inner membrane insertion protein [Parcubacteria group bacterium Gr01-1014_3]